MKRGPQPDIIIYSGISLGKHLVDARPPTKGFYFGTVQEVCNQFGIKYRKIDNRYAFYAPKSRLQKFVEKLHFAGIGYSNY